MKTVSITIPANFVVALSNLAANKDVRYYLCGVHISVKNGVLSMVATDGHLLGCLSRATDVSDFNLILSNDTIKKMSIFKDKDVTLTLQASCHEDTVLFGDIEGLKFEAVDGKYPDFERVLHPTDKVYSNQAAQLDFELLAKFVKVAKAMGCKDKAGQWFIQHNGATESCSISCPNVDTKEWTWRGVVMPLRV